MFDFKEKIKSYAFWLSSVSIIAIIIQSVMARMGKKIEHPVIAEILTAALGLLALTGVFAAPAQEEEGAPKDENKKDDDMEI